MLGKGAAKDKAGAAPLQMQQGCGTRKFVELLARIEK